MTDLSEAVTYLAHAEARRVRAVRSEELDELDALVGRRIPTLTVSRSASSSSDGLTATHDLRARAHDNADRLPFMCDFLNRCVLPLVDPEADVTGTYRIELHDSYSYLPGRAGYAEVLSFGRARSALERRVALLPDPYHIGGFGGLLEQVRMAEATDLLQQPLPWQDRAPKLFFAGTTTGERDPALNERVRACVWSLGRPDISSMHITGIAQMSQAAAQAVRDAGVVRPYIGVQDHFRYRYLVNIVGNTSCWSRVPMILSSRSLMVHVRHDDASWYYPLLREGCHYVGCDGTAPQQLQKAHAFCVNNDRLCRAVVDNANALASELFRPGTAAAYTAQLLEECARLGSP